MSHDPQSPSDAANMAAHDLEPDDPTEDAECEVCGEPMSADDINVEAFEFSGQILCCGCAEDLFEANGQFGAGA